MGPPTRDSGALPGNDTDSGPSVPPACVRALGDVKRFSEQVGSSALSVHFWTGASVRGPERFHLQLTHLGDKETGMLRKWCHKEEVYDGQGERDLTNQHQTVGSSSPSSSSSSGQTWRQEGAKRLRVGEGAEPHE
uniref:Uncharacterized protein n=1 Tax=Chromera velia CCMP2878 TaxID=1169474 RepID=A0A0G4FHJ4_9ALVE|eukprot:Cvel_16969.t1-p1 / transcript=Cvel_16969.t1 / gene=Cvel_16969 / organism=Chromera_velia_CCMP2878 / gene_product=hypothetical protein / transcript_product=hypothetical protein / location=Cvel_scaffold1331:47843-49446(+) / protein_length=134 / sequence_SO=supercontig / SO=protein_coding / is_pseudo=false